MTNQNQYTDLATTSTEAMAKSSGSTRPELSPQLVDKKLMIVLGVGGVIILIIVVLIIIFLFRNPAATSIIRDMSIIVLMILNIFIALLLLVIVGTLAYVVMKLNDLVHLFRREVEPVLKRTQEIADEANNTVKRVQNRVDFVGDEAVKPVINLLSTVSAAKETVRVLFKRN